MAATSYITAVQGIYAGLSAANFPGGVRTPGPFLDEAPLTGTGGAGTFIAPPYVLIFDGGGENRWTFNPPGQNAIVTGSFRLEAYALDLGDCDRIIAAILWNGQNPNNRAGLAFASLVLTAPEKGIAGSVIPTRNQRNYAGIQYQNQRVHVAKQWFNLQTAISGDGL